MAEQKGTGKHPHKSTEEPRPHHEAEESGSRKSSGPSSSSSKRSQSASSSQRSQSGGLDSGDLEQREYRDAQGEIHHHTRTYMEQHGSGNSGKSETGNKPRTHSAGSSAGQSGDLEERESREEQGNIHASKERKK